MTKRRIVLDTNVLVAGLRSRRGPAFRLLSLLDSRRFDLCVSVPLMFEYEDVLARKHIGVSASVASGVLDFICKVAIRQEIYFLWRPFLKDQKDDLVLEVAVTSQSQEVVTYNIKDFVGIEKFGIRATLPAEFLSKLGEKP